MTNNHILDEVLLKKLTLVFLFGFQFWFHVESSVRDRYYTNAESLTKPGHSVVRLMLNHRNDGAFICHLGLDTYAFDILLQLFAGVYPSKSRTGRPRSLGPDMALALTLMYLHNSMKQETLCLLFGVTSPTISRTKTLGLDLLELIFRQDPHDWRWDISWPSPSKMARFNDMILANTECENEPDVLKGVFGFVDGLNLPIQEPENEVEQNAYYNGWKSGCYSSQVLVFTPDGCICYVRGNCPGSWHDAEIAVKLYQNLLLPRCPEPYRLLADAGFPCTKSYKEKILRVPKKSEMKKLQVDDELRNRWKAITKHRQAAEWGMRAIQSGFGRLQLKLPADKAKRGQILFVVWRLHNFRTRLVGINQISTVYFRKWEEQQEISNFMNMTM
ncbi:hypothetical protein [Parasitella parasitica]|uniref:DDE Tnp4 domain-containing protein n=1 Tax=Parasitella parasitica TaxID=35722 RepID=A0A0B7NP09_9FUNG|nr:hypothetical protein [Parasitella parasitica]